MKTYVLKMTNLKTLEVISTYTWEDEASEIWLTKLHGDTPQKMIITITVVRTKNWNILAQNIGRKST
jgi:hypothetical protein